MTRCGREGFVSTCDHPLWGVEHTIYCCGVGSIPKDSWVSDEEEPLPPGVHLGPKIPFKTDPEKVQKMVREMEEELQKIVDAV